MAPLEAYPAGPSPVDADFASFQDLESQPQYLNL